jgi:hypothetical protein
MAGEGDARLPAIAERRQYGDGAVDWREAVGGGVVESGEERVGHGVVSDLVAAA